MEKITFLSSTFSLLFLLITSTITYIISKKINFPYTVLLVIVGLFLISLSRTQTFDFINHFKLTPDILFFVYLPIGIINFFKIEEKAIDELYQKEIITPKLYIKFKEEIEKEIEEDIKKVTL